MSAYEYDGDFGFLNCNRLTQCLFFQDWLAFAQGGVQLKFHGKLQFENGGAPLEQDNFAFCNVSYFFPKKNTGRTMATSPKSSHL